MIVVDRARIATRTFRLALLARAVGGAGIAWDSVGRSFALFRERM